jgi:hypothetical protein
MNKGAADLLVGMKAICQFLHGISEATALKWHRELGLPIKKAGENGYWVGSRSKIDAWSAEYAGS